MHYYLLSFSITVYLSAFWQSLPNLAYPLCFAIAALILVLVNRPMGRYMMPLALGALWATLWGQWLLSGTLPLAEDKTDYQVIGVIRGIPDRRSQSTRFILDVESVLPLGEATIFAPSLPELSRLQLNWYNSPMLMPGQRWMLTARLRSPRGFVNPGGFDYRLWLLRNRISATGYVRPANAPTLLASTGPYSLDLVRYRLSNSMYEFGNSLPGISDTAINLLVALTIGNKQKITRDEWHLLRSSGTIHLLIVSGLHIGMAAAFGMLIGTILGRCLSALGFSCNRVGAGASFALVFALFYAGLAEFSLPTQRALVMLAVFMAGIIYRRVLSPWMAFNWAMALQAIIDPLAVLSSGFWLSFGAVATFIWYFSCRARMSWWRSLLTAQALVLLMLSGFLLYFQGCVSLIAPLINLIAIPWFSLVIVPLVLLGALGSVVAQGIAVPVWWLATHQLQLFNDLLEALATYSVQGSWCVVSDQHLLIAVAALVAGVILLLPGGLAIRGLGCLLMAALVMARSPPGPTLDLTVLDVGQGLSVVVSTPEGTMVYDTGQKFSEKFDAGSGLIAPYLRHRGIGSVDKLVISHGDADHSGGVMGLMSEVDIHEIIAGQPENLSEKQLQRCYSGMTWQWGDVVFEIIHPERGASYSDNNSSCVIVVSLGEHRILLAGDIDVEVEQKLLSEHKLPQQVSVLVAPHHGSKTSSSPEFVTTLAPRHVVFAAGFRHHFGHPHYPVVRRYTDVNARQWTTGDDGAIGFRWSDQHALSVTTGRQNLRGYWHASF